MKKLITLTCLALTLLSCGGLQDEPAHAIELKPGSELLLPVYGATEQSQRDLEAGLMTHLSRKGHNLINARRLSPLAPYIEEDNICPGGNFQAKEIANCGRIAKVSALTTVFIEKINAYAPQSISLRISRVHLNGLSFSDKGTFLRIDLNSPREKARFQEFINSASLNTSSRSHTAALSPRDFLDYVGHRLAVEIEIMEKLSNKN